MERHPPNASHKLDSFGTPGQGDASSGLPKFSLLQRLVRPLVHYFDRDTSPYVTYRYAERGKVSVSFPGTMEVLMVLHLERATL